MSNNGRTREFPNKKFAMKVPAKHVRILETQQDMGWLYANDIEPAMYSRTKSTVVQLREDSQVKNQRKLAP